MALPLLLRATRPGFLGATVIACLIGCASAYHDLHQLRPDVALACLLGALLAHAAANVYNDVADAALGSDAINTARIAPFTGGSQLIQRGELSVPGAQRLALLLALGALAAGAWLTARCGPGIAGFGAAGFALGLAYSHPRVALMSRGLGELAVALGWWGIVIGCDYAQRGALAPTPALAGAGYAALLAGILLVNAHADCIADAVVGKRTLVVRLGRAHTCALLALILLFAHVWIVLLAGQAVLPVATLAAALTAPLAVHAWRQLCVHGAARAALRRAIVATLVLTQLHGLLLATALAIA